MTSLHWHPVLCCVWEDAPTAVLLWHALHYYQILYFLASSYLRPKVQNFSQQASQGYQSLATLWVCVCKNAFDNRWWSGERNPDLPFSSQPHKHDMEDRITWPAKWVCLPATTCWRWLLWDCLYRPFHHTSRRIHMWYFRSIAGQIFCDCSHALPW